MDVDQISRTLDERRTSDGKRKLMLTRAERNALTEHQMIERAVSLYLNLDEARSQREIASELGISVQQLKYLTQSDDFKAVYEEYFSELGHDPRLKATRAGMVDLLPLAYSRFQDLLENTNTPATVLLKSIEKVFELNSVKPQAGKVSDRKELAEFLGSRELHLTQVNIGAVPSQYREALDNVIEGQIADEVLPSADSK
jgi:Trp operon repressor